MSRQRKDLDDSAKARLLRAYNAGTPVRVLRSRFGAALYPVLENTKTQKRGRSHPNYQSMPVDL